MYKVEKSSEILNGEIFILRFCLISLFSATTLSSGMAAMTFYRPIPSSKTKLNHTEWNHSIRKKNELSGTSF